MEYMITSLSFSRRTMRGVVILISSLLFLASSPLVHAAAPTNGLVGYWSFSEGSGSTAGDASGNSNNGTLTNGPTWVTGKVGSGALSFDGVDDSVSLGAPSVLTPSAALTISAWVKSTNPTGAANEVIVDKQNASLNRYLLRITGTTGKMRFAVGASSEIQVNANTTLAANTWYHVAGVWNGADITVYVNGVSDATPVAVTGTITDGGEGIVIGRPTVTNANYFNGSIDEVRIYNRALTQAEIKRLYNMGR
jgi:hypothetical protein